MVAITITALTVTDGETVEVTFAEAFDVGDCFYYDPTVLKYRKADASGTEIQSGQEGVGISIGKGSADENGLLWISGIGRIDNTSLTQGHTYCVGGVSAGSIEVDADVNAGNYRKTVLFVAQASSGSTQQVVMSPIYSGVTA